MVIRRSLSWARPQGEEVRPRYFPPKTKAGRRTISIPALLVAELKRWKLQCPISEDGLVFPTTDGKPMPRAKMLQTQFYPALSRAKLRRVTFHTLRHSCASAMIASGAPITEAASVRPCQPRHHAPRVFAFPETRRERCARSARRCTIEPSFSDENPKRDRIRRLAKALRYTRGPVPVAANFAVTKTFDRA
jgi:Phage integrase family